MLEVINLQGIIVTLQISILILILILVFYNLGDFKLKYWSIEYLNFKFLSVYLIIKINRVIATKNLSPINIILDCELCM